jgi:hypothetical protein
VEVIEGWRKLHNEKLHNLHSSKNIIRLTKSRRVEWAGHIECMMEIRNEYKSLVRQSEMKRPFMGHRHGW